MDIYEVIKNNPLINITLKGEDLQTFAKKFADEFAQQTNNKTDKLYSRSEVQDKFKICSTTLWRWDSLGLIKSKKIGNRRYYSESEIKRLIEQNQK